MIGPNKRSNLNLRVEEISINEKCRNESKFVIFTVFENFKNLYRISPSSEMLRDLRGLEKVKYSLRFFGGTLLTSISSFTSERRYVWGLPSSMSGSAPAYIHVTEGSDFFLFFKKIISLQYKFAVKKCSSSQ